MWTTALKRAIGARAGMLATRRRLACAALVGAGVMLAACSPSGLLSSSSDDSSSQRSGLARLLPGNLFSAGYATPANPAGLPAGERACRKALKRARAEFRDLAPIRDGATCGIDHPVSLSRIGSVRIAPAATLTCDMALALAQWTRSELVPAARWRYWSGVDTIRASSAYSCRNVAGSGKPSQHASGNAIDISRIVLNSGREIDVAKPGFFAFRERGFLNSVRSDGCSYFNTTLGPGYDELHADHFHFDIRARGKGGKYCR